jgi:hypothetical protein
MAFTSTWCFPHAKIKHLVGLSVQIRRQAGQSVVTSTMQEMSTQLSAGTFSAGQQIKAE